MFLCHSKILAHTIHSVSSGYELIMHVNIMYLSNIRVFDSRFKRRNWHMLCVFINLCFYLPSYIPKTIFFSLFASMVPRRPFKIHKTFPLCKRFYIVEKVSNTKRNTKKKYSFKNCSEKGSLGNPKMALHGIAAKVSLFQN